MYTCKTRDSLPILYCGDYCKLHFFARSTFGKFHDLNRKRKKKKRKKKNFNQKAYHYYYINYCLHLSTVLLIDQSVQKESNLTDFEKTLN